MSIPAYIVLGIYIFGFTFNLINHGKPKDPVHWFFNANAYFWSMVIMLGLLLWGGFFDIK